MPGSRPSLDVATAREVINRIAAPCSTGPAVGLEMEWHTYPAGDRTARCDIDHLQAVCHGLQLPGGSRVTFEPGGQVELSGPPAPTVAAACDGLAADADALMASLASSGIEAVAAGSDTQRPPVRTLQHPRYAVMEAYFDQDGPAGRRMMCGTAAMQVNVDAGADPSARWALVHAVGPALAAAFATSPAPGFASDRLATWQAIDRSRTRSALGAGEPAADWADFALAARLMLLRIDGDRCAEVDGDMTMAGWIEHGHRGVWPDESDIAYHLTTLFPPVRLRTWLELRFLDSLPAPWWRAAAVTTATVLADDDLGATVGALAQRLGVVDRWAVAARRGLDHPGLAAVAVACLGGAAEVSGDPVVAQFLERFTSKGRAPGRDAGRCVA
ncbi:MAG: glutamate-cysteine ligase family protein [Acidimicrobiales bacterium]